MDTTTVRSADGTELIVCAQHHLSLCHRCCLDFEECNEEAREARLCSTDVCDYPPCSAKGETKRCGGCRNVWYCSQRCQARHWRDHRPSCQTHADVRVALGLGQPPAKLFRNGTTIVAPFENADGTWTDRRAKIVRYIPGSGPYTNPLIEYNPRNGGDWRNDWCLPRYAIKFLDTGVVTSNPCSDCHLDWKVSSS
mmetsp:Transcript_2707/g.6308  ORF Transcript_2707/g.6308 Transcript_2707/m.6308 type:complete len:195 (-) Transcript_2707:1002-1586(-)